MSPNPAVLTWPRPVTAGGGDVTLTFIGGSSSLTGRDIGAAASDRIVFVAYSARVYHATAPSSVTIGGVAATVDAIAFSYGENYFAYVLIAHATVPTGATATIDVTGHSAFVQAAAALIWTLTGGTPTAYDTATAFAASTTATLTVDATAGGIAIGACISGNDWAEGHTWAALAEDYDAQLASRQRSGASATGLSAGALAVTVTIASSYGTDASAVVSYSIS